MAEFHFDVLGGEAHFLQKIEQGENHLGIGPGAFEP